MALCCTSCCHWWWTNGETETETGARTQSAVASHRLAEEAPAVTTTDEVPGTVIPVAVPETVIPVAQVPVAKVLVVEQDDDHEWDDAMY